MLKSLVKWGIVIALVLLAGARWKPEWTPHWAQDACHRIGFCTAPADVGGVLLKSLQQQSRLVVMRALLAAPIHSARTTTVATIPLQTTRQTVIVDAQVDYSVDLSVLKPNDLQWNPDSATLTIRRPKVEVGDPNVRWDKAQIYGDRNLSTTFTDVRENLDADNRARAPEQFRALATSEYYLTAADASADKALATLLGMVLQAMGQSGAKVAVTH